MSSTIGMEEGVVDINSTLVDDSQQQVIFQDASLLVEDLNAPRAPATPSGRHLSRRAPQEPKEVPSDSKADTNVDNVDGIDRMGRPNEITAQEHFHSSPPQRSIETSVENKEERMGLSILTYGEKDESNDDMHREDSPKVSPPQLQNPGSCLDEALDRSLSGGSKRQWTPVRGSGEERLASPGLISRALSSGSGSRGSSRPVSREDVKRMEIPTFEKLQRAKSPMAQMVIEEVVYEREGDGDDSSVTSLNSTDDALISELRRSLAEGVPEQEQPAAVKMPQPQPIELPDEGLGQGVTVLSNDNEGISSDDDGKTNLNIDLAEFDFATGGMMEGEGKTGSEEMAGVSGAVKTSTSKGEVGFTDAMATRPRTNERPSSTQEKYMRMYQRTQTPQTAEREDLVGLEFDLGAPEPQSARSGESLLTMSSIDSVSVRGSSVATMRATEKATKVSMIPFPFPSRPNMPHVDTGITNEKLTYKEIKKPFETQSDEVHKAVRDKIMKKQLRRQRKQAALAEFERREREKEGVLLAEFTREQVYSAMEYFRTMCVRLGQEDGGRDRSKKKDISLNQLEGAQDEVDDPSSLDEASTANQSSLSGSDSRSRYGMKARLKNLAVPLRGKIAPRRTGDANAKESIGKHKAKKDRKVTSRFEEGRFVPPHDGEIKLNELEAVVRKFKRAKASVEDEEYGRGLLLSLEWLLDELDLSPMEWFTMVDSRDGTKIGDEKLTYLELARGIDMLCDELSSQMSKDIRTKQRSGREGLKSEMTEATLTEDVGATHPKPASGKGAGSPEIEGLAPLPLFTSAGEEQSVSSKGTTASQEYVANFTGKESSVQVPRWRRNDIHSLLRYLDPNGDGDISVCEMKLAFRNLHLTQANRRTVEESGPIIVRLVEYMHEKQLTVREVFAMIDTDKSNSISCDELFEAMNKFFQRQPTEAELAQRRAERMALIADLDSSGSLASDDDLSLSASFGNGSLGSLGGNGGSMSVSVDLSSAAGTRGWAGQSVAGTSIQSSVPSRFGYSKTSDMSSSWQPRGQLNSRGKHKFLRKSVSSVVVRPVKTRKKKKMAEQDAGTTTSSSRLPTTASRAGTGSITRGGASPSSAAWKGTRFNSESVPAKEQLKGSRRGGTFVNTSGSGLPGIDANGVPDLSVSSGLVALGASAKTTSKTRLSNAKLQRGHKAILDTYSDLFDRQYDAMRSHMLPE